MTPGLPGGGAKPSSPRYAPPAFDTSATAQRDRLILKAESVLAAATSYTIEEACLLHSFQVSNAGVGGAGTMICVLRHGGSGSSSRAIWSLALPSGAGNSNQIIWSVPVYCPNGFGLDFTGVVAVNYSAQVTFTRLFDHSEFRVQGKGEPTVAFSGKGVNEPIIGGEPPGPPGPGHSIITEKGGPA